MDSWWDEEKYKNADNAEINHEFDNVKPNEKYTLHPLVKLMKIEMVANPSANVEIEPHIITGKASKTDESQTTLSAQVNVESDTETYQAGFCYYAEDGKLFRTFVDDSGSKEIQINITGLEADTEYSYYAFLKLGDYFECGEIKKFRTTKTIELEKDVQYELDAVYSYGISWKVWIDLNEEEIPDNCLQKGILIYDKDDMEVVQGYSKSNIIKCFVNVRNSELDVIEQNYWASSGNRYKYRIFFDIQDSSNEVVRLYSSLKPIVFDYKERPDFIIKNLQVLETTQEERDSGTEWVPVPIEDYPYYKYVEYPYIEYKYSTTIGYNVIGKGVFWCELKMYNRWLFGGFDLDPFFVDNVIPTYFDKCRNYADIYIKVMNGTDYITDEAPDYCILEMRMRNGEVISKIIYYDKNERGIVIGAHL